MRTGMVSSSSLRTSERADKAGRRERTLLSSRRLSALRTRRSQLAGRLANRFSNKKFSVKPGTPVQWRPTGSSSSRSVSSQRVVSQATRVTSDESKSE